MIGASNAPLRDLVAAGSFRADLFYRLSVLSIELPPLRERAGDVELLTTHFLNSFREPRASRLCISRARPWRRWPRTLFRATCGNWRTPCAARWRSPPNGLVTIDCLPPEIAAPAGSGSPAAARGARPDCRPAHHGRTCSAAICNLFWRRRGWNRRRAASVLDLDRRTIQRLIARYKLQGAVDPEGEDESEPWRNNLERSPDLA